MRAASSRPTGRLHALTAVFAGCLALFAIAASAAADADPPAQTDPATSASDTQQRLKRLEESQQALQRQLQENAAEIQALKKQSSTKAPPTPNAVPAAAAGAATNEACPAPGEETGLGLDSTVVKSNDTP